MLFLELFAELVNSVMSDSWIVQNLRAIIADLSDECTFTEITVDVAEGYRWRIEMIYRDFLAKEIMEIYKGLKWKLLVIWLKHMPQCANL